MSVTSGVVSRIEVTGYAHGAAELLGIQVGAWHVPLVAPLLLVLLLLPSVICCAECIICFDLSSEAVSMWAPSVSTAAIPLLPHAGGCCNQQRQQRRPRLQ